MYNKQQKPKMRTLRVSAVPSLLGAWGSEAALQTWDEVRGLAAPRPASFIMRLGSEMTDDILRMWGFPEDGAREVPLRLEFEDGVLIGHADGIYDGTVWEAKLTRRWTARALNAARAQATLYAAMAGVQRIKIVVFEMFSQKLLTYEEEFDPALYSWIEAALRYLFRHWDDDRAPLAVRILDLPQEPKQELPADLLQAIVTLADEWREITERLKELEQEKQAIEQRLKEYCAALGGSVQSGAYRVELKRYTTTVYDIPKELKQQFARQKEVERLIVKVGDEEDSG